MNIIDSEEPYEVTAKTCGCRNKQRKVTYPFAESFQDLSKAKKDAILSEIDACERLRNYARDEINAQTIEKEITELKMMLDLLP